MKTTGVIPRLGALSGIGGSVVLSVAVALPLWHQDAISHTGMFRGCSNGKCKSYEIKDMEPIEMFVIRFIAIWTICMAFIATTLALISILPCFNTTPIKMTGLFFIIAGLSQLGCAVTYTVMYDRKPQTCLGKDCTSVSETKALTFGTSFYLCWVSALLLLVGGVLCFIHYEKRPRKISHRASLHHEDMPVRGYDVIQLENMKQYTII